MHAHYSLDATLEAVSGFTQGMENTLRNLSLEVRTQIVLALQELLVNIVRHAYAGEPGKIEVDLNHEPDSIVLSIQDFGPNRLTMPEVIQPIDPATLPEHGMGLFIIHQSFDTVTYERRERANHWQLAKAFGDHHA